MFHIVTTRRVVYLSFVVMGWLLVTGLGCDPAPPPTQINCQSDAECPGTQVCQSGKCGYDVTTPPKEQSGREPMTDGKQEPLPTEKRPEVPVDSRMEPPAKREPSTNEPIVETRVDAAPPEQPSEGGGCEAGPERCECADGETRECYDGASTTLGKGGCQKGVQTCQNGRWSGCAGQTLPTTEKCDGNDNDCDGQIDEEWSNLGGTCSVGKGECESSGSWVCKSDGSGVECSAQPGSSSTEVCDGKDNDCDGQVDETFPEKGTSCLDSTKQGECQKGVYNSCTSGQLVCRSTTNPASKEICDNKKDDDCDGLVDESPPCVCQGTQTRSCYGGPTGTDRYSPCRAGTQKCSSGSWGLCTGEVRPKAESCDNVDNDCNGLIDDKLQRTCLTTCGKGTEVCKAGKWVSCSAPQPQLEKCNGKDDDCDGSIDETFTNKGKKCVVGKGDCARSSLYACNRLGTGTYCPVSAGKAVVERCRDQRDNDCDGMVDDICGLQHPFAVIDGVKTTPSVSRSYLLKSVKRISAGKFQISMSGFSCASYPLMLSLATTTRRPSSYLCSGSDYIVYLGSNNTTTLADWRFSVVVPRRVTGAGYARITSCPATGLCKMTGAYGITRIDRVAQGSYVIESPLCKSSTQPVFAHVYSSLPGYVIGGSNRQGTGKCYLRVYDTAGVTRNAYFGIWLPPVASTAWALVPSTGTSPVANTFNDSFAKWSTNRVSTGRYSVTFPAFASPSAVLAQPRGFSSKIGSSWIDFYRFQFASYQLLTGGTSVYIRDVKNDKLVDAGFQVLFMQ